MAADGQRGGGTAGPAPAAEDSAAKPPVSSAELQERCRALAQEARKILDDAVTLRQKIKSAPQKKPELTSGAVQMASLKEKMTELKEKVEKLVPKEWLKEDKCANQHKLKPFVTLRPSDEKYRRVWCDVCTMEQKPGSRMRGCRPCNYDVCATCEAVTPITTLVWEPWRRGMSCVQFEEFFKEYCGSILYPQGDEGKAVAVVTKLAAKCFEKNQKDALEKRDIAFPSMPNLYAVNEFFIKEHTKGERCPNKHKLAAELFQVPDDAGSISCSDCGQVQPKGSKIKRCAEVCKYHVCHGCQGKVEKCPKNHTLEPFSTTAEKTKCSLCSEDLLKDSRMRTCKECNYAVCDHCVVRTAECDNSHKLVPDAEEHTTAVRCGICEQGVKKCAGKCPVQCKYFVCSTCTPKKRLVSYAEHLNPEGKKIDFFISHHWGEDFGEFIQSLIRHAVLLQQVWAQKEQLKKDWRQFVYWCCAFANNQHMVKLGDELESSPFCKALKFQGCLATIMNLNQMVTALFRIWCSYEVMLTHQEKKSFMVCTRNGPLIPDNTEQADLKDAWVVHMNTVLSDFNVKNAESTAEKDQKDIMAAIQTFKPDDCDGASGVDAFNLTVKSMLAGQALYTLARNGDREAVRTALEAKADPMKKDSQGIPAITYAVGKLQALRKNSATEGGEAKVKDYEETIKHLRGAVQADTFSDDLAEEVLDMWDPATERRIEAFKVYRERSRKEPKALVVELYKDAYTLAMERHKRVCKKSLETHAKEDHANLCYAPTKYHLRLVEEYIKKLQETANAEGLVEILAEALKTEDAREQGDMQVAIQRSTTTGVAVEGTGDMLMVVLTDLEPDDVMATAQMWQLWKQELAEPPLVCFLTNFGDEDKGRIFPQKLLISALMLGLPEISILPAPPDSKTKLEGAPRSIVEAHEKTIEDICERLVKFEGKTISLKLLAPARGHLASIVASLKKRGENVWAAVKAKMVVAMYSGRFNVKSSTEEDFDALKEIMRASREPLIDVAKFSFFGGADPHPMTASFTTFAPESFAGKLNKHAPLLAAVLKTFNDEFNAKLIKPQPKLFEKCSTEHEVKQKLGEEAFARWKVIEQLYVPDDYAAIRSYAKVLQKDKDLMKAVAGYKKSTVVAYALEGCDSPLCDQLLFLHAWLEKDDKDRTMLAETRGEWELDTKNGWTKVKERQPGEVYDLHAVQPAVADPFDERVLKKMQNALEDYLMRHLSGVYNSNA